MFPRKIPSLVTTVSVNETGLTDPQTVTLLAAVNVLKLRFIRHARNISVM